MAFPGETFLRWSYSVTAKPVNGRLEFGARDRRTRRTTDPTTPKLVRGEATHQYRETLETLDETECPDRPAIVEPFLGLTILVTP